MFAVSAPARRVGSTTGSIPFRMEKAKGAKRVIPMPRWHAALPGWAGALLAVMLALAGCGRSSPEQQLRDQFAALQQAVEQRRPADAMDGVADDFSGPGGMDRAALHNLLRAQLLARDSVGVTTGPLEVSLQGETATIRFDALLTGSGRGRWLPDSAQSYHVTTGWRREGGDWRIHYAEWRAGP